MGDFSYAAINLTWYPASLAELVSAVRVWNKPPPIGIRIVGKTTRGILHKPGWASRKASLGHGWNGLPVLSEYAGNRTANNTAHHCGHHER
jgi:hypothetical protein